MKLQTEVKNTHYIHWFTSSNPGIVGLSDFLAQVVGYHSDSIHGSVIELEDVPLREMVWIVTVDMVDISSDSVYITSGKYEEITERLQYGRLDSDEIDNVFKWLLKRGYIEPGNYVLAYER